MIAPGAQEGKHLRRQAQLSTRAHEGRLRPLAPLFAYSGGRGAVTATTPAFLLPAFAKGGT